MVKWIVVAVLLLPVLEIAVFVAVAWLIGFGWAMALMLATTLAGFLVLKSAGRRRLARFRVAVADSDIAGFQAHTGGFLTVVGGILLLLPGFLTDMIGALLLLRPVRRWCAGAFRRAAKGFAPGGGTRRPVIDLDRDQWRQLPDRDQSKERKPQDR